MSAIDDFLKLDIRVGRIVSATLRDDLRIPAIQLSINFGDEIGVLTSSAQITKLYTCDSVQDKNVVAIVNTEPKQIANIISQCLVLGFNTEKGVVLIEPDQDLALGSKLA